MRILQHRGTVTPCSREDWEGVSEKPLEMQMKVPAREPASSLAEGDFCKPRAPPLCGKGYFVAITWPGLSWPRFFPLAPECLGAADNAAALGQPLLSVAVLVRVERITHVSNLFVEFASLELGACLLGKLLFPSNLLVVE